jgi:hypothetical protein
MWKRKWRKESSLADLTALIRTDAELPSNAVLKLTYKDKDGDKVRLAKEDGTVFHDITTSTKITEGFVDWQSALEECGPLIFIFATKDATTSALTPIRTSSGPALTTPGSYFPFSFWFSRKTFLEGTMGGKIASTSSGGWSSQTFGSSIVNNRYVPCDVFLLYLFSFACLKII